MWPMITSIVHDLTTASWTIRLLSTGLVVLSLFSLGYLFGYSAQTLQTMTQPAPSWTKTNGSAFGHSNGSLMDRHEMLRTAKNKPLILRPGYESLSIVGTVGK